ncbi:hypothetical protein QCA50_010062 [Cerrena zonata]|uniref:Uncharacterized protein n=1 Tax=Cerrena zonata TaxID=2478898 RepID=A0AAW0G9U4_9APHY
MASVEVELGVTPETTYSIAGKQIKFDSHADIEPYLKELESKDKVSKINFSGNTIGIEASESFEEDSDLIEKINDIFTERGFGELDELDDLEEIDSEDEDEDDDETNDDEADDEDLDQLEKELANLDLNQNDKAVDDIADELSKAHIK